MHEINDDLDWFQFQTMSDIVQKICFTAAISVFHFLTQASIKVQLDLTVVSKITITIKITIRRLFQHNWSAGKLKDM